MSAFPPYFLRHGLSLNLDLTVSARLAGEQASGSSFLCITNQQ